ncbi:MAG: hypothetical protein WDN48_10345 [Pseudolabrys sp.]
MKCPKWFEHALAILGVCCVQDTPMRWVAIHRRHHEHADESPDPHSPLVNFLLGPCRLVAGRKPGARPLAAVRSLHQGPSWRDPFYVGHERNYNYYKVLVVSWLVVYAAGFAAEFASRRHAHGSRAVRLEPLGVGRVSAHRAGVASDLGGELAQPHVGLPQLRDRRRQPQQLV